MTIYFVQPENEPFVKIGYASNVVARVRGLQVSNHKRLVLLGTLRGTVETEQALLRQFRKHLVRGEWFHLVPEIIEAIGPQDGNQDIAHLDFYRDAYKTNGSARLGAPIKFDPAKKREARKLLGMKERRTLSKKSRRTGKPLVVWRPIYSKIEIADMVGVSTGTLHNWIRGGMK
jgi:hypothetical protein